MKKNLILLAVGLIIVPAIVLSQGKFSGYMFGDYYFNIARDSSYTSKLASSSASNGAAPGAKAMQAFQLRRVYLGYDNDISDQFTTRFRLEADQAQETVDGTKAATTIPATGGSVANPASKISVFVKDAYLKWKNVFSGSDLIFGIQPPPAYEVSEAAWGYRSLEKTIMDLRGIVSSRDQGISLHGKVVSDGMVNYWVMVANSSGNSPETDKYKRYYAHVHVKPITNLQATVYVDLKDAADLPGAKSNSTLTTALFVGYAEPFSYNVGFEAFMASQSNGYTPPGGSLGSKSALGISVFGSYNILPELAIVARYDNYDPNTDGKSKGDLRNLIIAGLSYKADKNVSIMPNIYYESYEAPTGGTAPDASVTARLTLYYVFL